MFYCNSQNASFETCLCHIIIRQIFIHTNRTKTLCAVQSDVRARQRPFKYAMLALYDQRNQRIHCNLQSQHPLLYCVVKYYHYCD